MLRLDCDGRYGDVMERALYNGVLSGVSLDGSKFFYDNPLASRGTHHRRDWFDCSCCPPNIARLLASLGEYVYSESDDEVAVHLYIQSATTVNVAGQAVMLEQQTEYPWDGELTLHVSPQKAARFALKLRRPGWCEKHQLSVNGKSVNAQEERGYLRIDREWKAGDRIELNLAMPVARIYAHPQVRMNCGRVVLQRGPLVYCIEGVDNESDLNALSLPRESDLKIQFEKTYLAAQSPFMAPHEDFCRAIGARSSIAR